jgi:hypothetical protein
MDRKIDPCAFWIEAIKLYDETDPDSVEFIMRLAGTWSIRLCKDQANYKEADLAQDRLMFLLGSMRRHQEQDMGMYSSYEEYEESSYKGENKFKSRVDIETDRIINKIGYTLIPKGPLVQEN